MRRSVALATPLWEDPCRAAAPEPGESLTTRKQEAQNAFPRTFQTCPLKMSPSSSAAGPALPPGHKNPKHLKRGVGYPFCRNSCPSLTWSSSRRSEMRPISFPAHANVSRDKSPYAIQSSSMELQATIPLYPSSGVSHRLELTTQPCTTRKHSHEDPGDG
jgi:hypothetical protein